MKILFTLTIVTSLAAISCKSRKHLPKEGFRHFDSAVFSGNASSDSLLRKDWTYFSGRLETDFYSESQNLSGNISLRMKKDSILWFSASVSIGLQVAKGIITRDSVKILDLYEKKYYQYTIKELGNMLGAEVSLRELQNIILGNPVFDTLVYRRDLKTGGWFGSQNPLTNVLFAQYFSALDSSYISQDGSKRQLRASYNGRKNAGAFDVAEKMAITGVSDSKTVRLDIAFTTASDAVIPSYPFKVPDDYERQ